MSETQPAPALAPEPAALTYTDVSGDTAWAIAERLYGDGSKYRMIAATSGVPNPDLIHTGARCSRHPDCGPRRAHHLGIRALTRP
ncbi:LysM peptidoglycan-binding domain-containing protein [Mycobacterium lacus]|uniref:LysM peptidoglycan-binding domain-containing protein n=1 Tax=Mycobacterium lacus TaxID=169765 RepID=UPI000A22A75B|nr:hypothetical protein AWC15_09795 [Mycobacterium lacus]